MKLYYDNNNEIILRIGNDHKVHYERKKLGELLLDFIYLDFDKIREEIDVTLNLPLPINISTLNNNIKIIEELQANLSRLHPYLYESGPLGSTEFLMFDIAKYRYISEKYIKGQETNPMIAKTDIDKSIQDFSTTVETIYSHVKIAAAELYVLQQEYKAVLDFCFNSTVSELSQQLTPIQNYYIYTEGNEKGPSFYNTNLNVKYRIGSKDTGIVDMFIDQPEDKTLLFEAICNPADYLTVYELYEGSARDFCYFELIKLISNSVPIIVCKNCEKLFLNTRRADTIYCENCKNIGAMNAYKEKVKKDPAKSLYDKAYKRNYARVSNKKITKQRFLTWSHNAKTMYERTKNNQMTLENFEKWIKNNEAKR